MHRRLSVLIVAGLTLVVVLTGCGSAPVAVSPTIASVSAPPTPTPAATLMVATPAPAPTSIPTPTVGTTATLLAPGDKLGDMAVTNSQGVFKSIGAYCDPSTFVPAGEKMAHPGRATFTCKPVPHLSGLDIGDGWFASTTQLLDSNWKAITWELYIDGRQVDLPKFGTNEPLARGGQARMWRVKLEQMTLGPHMVRSVYRISQSIFDGQYTYPAGTYDTIDNLTFTANDQQPS